MFFKLAAPSFSCSPCSNTVLLDLPSGRVLPSVAQNSLSLIVRRTVPRIAPTQDKLFDMQKVLVEIVIKAACVSSPRYFRHKNSWANGGWTLLIMLWTCVLWDKARYQLEQPPPPHLTLHRMNNSWEGIKCTGKVESALLLILSDIGSVQYWHNAHIGMCLGCVNAIECLGILYNVKPVVLVEKKKKYCSLHGNYCFLKTRLVPQSGAHRRGALSNTNRDFHPTQPFKSVYTEAFKPVSGSMWQSVVR